jgi:membrane-bound metal-dependent hydrolase YbcI (DUF457 family)
MNSASDSATNAAAAGIFGGMMLFIIVIVCALTVFFVWLFWRVFTKTGMNGALGLLCLVPSIGPLVCLLILAFSRWPIEDALLAHGGGLLPPPEPPAGSAPPPGTSVMPT